MYCLIAREYRKEAAWIDGSEQYPLENVTKVIAGEGEWKVCVKLLSSLGYYWRLVSSIVVTHTSSLDDP